MTLTRESELPVVWCPWTVWPVCNSVGSKEGHQAGGWFSVPTFPRVSNQHLHFWLAKYITFIKTKLFSPLGSATPERSCLLPRAGRWRVHWPQGLEVRDWFRIEACGEKFQDSDNKASTLWRRKGKKGKEKKKLLFLKKKKKSHIKIDPFAKQFLSQEAPPPISFVTRVRHWKVASSPYSRMHQRQEARVGIRAGEWGSGAAMQR